MGKGVEKVNACTGIRVYPKSSVFTSRPHQPSKYRFFHIDLKSKVQVSREKLRCYACFSNGENSAPATDRKKSFALCSIVDDSTKESACAIGRKDLHCRR